MARMQHRDHGSGSIYQRASDGMWVASLTLPPRDGKRRRKTVTATRKSDVIAKLRDLRRELDRAGDLPTSSPTLGAWLETWMQEVTAKRLKPRTAATYRGYLDGHIIPEIGGVRLSKLTTDHVRQLHKRFSRLGLSDTSALQAHRILARALKDAENEGKVPRNVATLIDAPRKAVSKRTALTADQARVLLYSVRADGYQAARWSLALLLGLRQGEALGLTRDALDLDRGILTVSWQLQRLAWRHGCAKVASGWECGYARAGFCPDRISPVLASHEAVQVHGGLWLTRPKSKAGWREIPLPAALCDALKARIKSSPPGKHGLILTRDKRPVDPRRDFELWKQALKNADLPDVPLHSARHTTATLLHALGADERTRVAILGHSSATVTAGYTHVTDDMARGAIESLAGLIA